MSDHIHINKTPSNSKNGGDILCSFGGVVRKLPHASLVAIEPFHKAAAIPFATEHLEGLVFNIDGLSPQFNLARFLGAKTDNPKYAVIVKTAKGLVRVSADAVLTLNADELPEHEKTISAMNDIEKLITSFDAETGLNKKVQHTSALKKPTHSVLIVKVGDQTFGMHANTIHQIERHQKTKPGSLKNPTYRVITMQDGSLVSGISVGSWLQLKNTSPETEVWSIAYALNKKILALTVNEVIALDPIELTKFFMLEQEGEMHQWVNHPTLGAIEILNPEKMIHPDEYKAIKNIALEEEVHILTEKETMHELATKDLKHQGVGLKFDRFNVVLPQEMISSVSEKMMLSSLHKKSSKDAIPAFDLLQVLEDKKEPSKRNATRRVATVKFDNGNKAVFMAEEVYEPHSDQPWLPAPALPKPLSKIIQAVRVQDDRCELLLDPAFIHHLAEKDLKDLRKKTFSGWQPLKSRSH